MPTELQKLADEKNPHVRCVCHNVIPLDSAYCPFCNKFNAANSLDECPTCGQRIGLESMVDQLNASIVELQAEIAELKKPAE